MPTYVQIYQNAQTLFFSSVQGTATPKRVQNIPAYCSWNALGTGNRLKLEHTL